MRGFTILILFLFILFFLFSVTTSNVDLTPYDGPVVNGANSEALSQTTGDIPLAPTPGVQTGGSIPNTGEQPMQAQTPVATATVPAGCPTPSIPVTGTCPYQPIPVTGTCGVQYIPVTGCPPVQYIPVTGYPVVGIPVTGVCTNPYIITYGDTLSRIARNCGSNVAAIVTLNPGLTNPNLIYPGQVIWIYSPTTGSPSIPVTGPVVAPTVVVPVNPVVLTPSLSPIPAGTDLTVTVSGFPPQTPVNIGIGRPGVGYQVVNTAITDASGVLRTAAVVPETDDPNAQWVVLVVTTQGTFMQAQSEPFTIGTPQP